MSILKQKLDDTNAFALCYLFEGFWIELSPNLKTESTELDSNNQRWYAFIHSDPNKQTAITVGLYSTRLEAALKAELIVRNIKKPLKR